MLHDYDAMSQKNGCIEKDYWAEEPETLISQLEELKFQNAD